MQQLFISIITDVLPILGLFLCGFLGWAGAKVLKKQLQHRLSSGSCAQKISEEDWEEKVSPPSGRDTNSSDARRSPAPNSAARRRNARKQAKQQATAVEPVLAEAPSVEPTVQQTAPENAALAAPSELVETPAVEEATESVAEATQSDRIAKLMAKKAARKARKAQDRTVSTEELSAGQALEAETTEETVQQATAEAFATRSKDEVADAATVIAAASAADATQPEPDPVDESSSNLVEEPATDADISFLTAIGEEAPEVGDALSSFKEDCEGEGQENKVLWCTQEIEEGEWKDGIPPALTPKLPRRCAQEESGDDVTGSTCSPQSEQWQPQIEQWIQPTCLADAYAVASGTYQEESRSSWNDSSWSGERGGSSWNKGSNSRWRRTWNDEAEQAEDQDGWMTSFGAQKPRQQAEPLQLPDPLQLPVMCMDNQTGTLPMLTPVNGSGVFIDGEQSYELAMVPVDVPVQDFIGAGVSEIQAFDPYNPAGLDLAVQQEQKWALDDNSGWTNEWRGDMQVDSWNANWAPAW